LLNQRRTAVSNENKEQVKNKGVVLNQNKEVMIFDSYLLVFSHMPIQKNLKFDKLTVNTVSVEKVGLDGYYDKRML
jgi:uncharacterized membrane-anchored protein